MWSLQPVYEALFGFHVFGLGFVTSMGFIIGTGELLFLPMDHSSMMSEQLHESSLSRGRESVLGLGWLHEPLVCCAGVFVSSWLGGLLLQVADWIIKKLPLIKHIYSAAKQACPSSFPPSLALHSCMQFS